MPGMFSKHVIFDGIGEGGVDTLLDYLHFLGVQKMDPFLERVFGKKRSKMTSSKNGKIIGFLYLTEIRFFCQKWGSSFWTIFVLIFGPAKKSKKMTFAKPIFQIWPKSRILTLFSKKTIFPKKGVIFRQNVDFPCALKVVKSGQKGVKKGSFWHFLRTLEIPDIFDKTQARL